LRESFARAAERVIDTRAAEVFEQAHDVLDVGDIERVTTCAWQPVGFGCARGLRALLPRKPHRKS